MPILPADELRRVGRLLLETAGTPDACATLVANSLVDANLTGHDSHGVIRLLGYIESVQLGQVEPTATPDLLGRDRATARIDGRWGWGQPAMWLATEEAAALAREFGIGAAVVHNCYHIGRVAPYVESLASQNLIGLALANAGPAVAPHGGSGRVMGTNPIAWAVPRAGGETPLSFDIATAGVAEGKVRVARAKGEQVRPGLIVDPDGRPSTDPEAFYAGGALLPFGGHKGYGFNVLAEILGKGLAGLDAANLVSQRGVNGPLIITLDPEVFVPLRVFVAVVEAQCAAIKAAPPTEGVGAVMLPGEPEIAMRQHRLTDGIPVADRTWDDLIALAGQLGATV